MLDFATAPRKGRVLAYAMDRLVYAAYEVHDGEVILRSGADAGARLDLAGVSKLHLFDSAAEFRAELVDGSWMTRLMRAEDEVEDEDHFVFSESQFVKERWRIAGPDERIVVNNRFSFNEGGFLRLEGYRLATESDD